MAKRAPQRIASYEIRDQIGAGGMATVFRAYQPSLDRQVAIKVLPGFYADKEGFRERFRQEALAVARLRHPNIITVFDYGEHRGSAYIVSEFMDGGALTDRLAAPLSMGEALSLLGPVASALDYAHGEGVLHRDIKPGNILVTRKGVPVLSDFGLAKILASDAGLTESGTVLGTPEYMAPEQASGQELGPAADQYSLAVVAYRLLTGKVPFDKPTPVAVLVAHLQEAPPRPSSLNAALEPSTDAAVMKALAKKPSDRFGSCAEFVRALQPAAVLPARQSRWAGGIAVAAILVAIASIAVGLWSLGAAQRKQPVISTLTAAGLAGPTSVAGEEGTLLVVADGGRPLVVLPGHGPSAPTWKPATPDGPLPVSVSGIDFAPNGDLYLADASGGRVFHLTGDCPGTAVCLHVVTDQVPDPIGVAVDGAGTVFVIGGDAQLYRAGPGPDSAPVALAGKGEFDPLGDVAIQMLEPSQLRFVRLGGVAADTGGKVYVSDAVRDVVYSFDPALVASSGGIVGGFSVVAGTGKPGATGDGGSADHAKLNGPTGLAVDRSGDLYIADTGNNRVRRVDAKTGVITTVAGLGVRGGRGDGGPASAAALNDPTGVWVDRFGVLYIADTGNKRIRVVTPAT